MSFINETLSFLQTFGEYSGLKINKDKTIGMLAWALEKKHKKSATNNKLDEKSNKIIRNFSYLQFEWNSNDKRRI